MQSYLERYLNGEYVGVWAELVALGPAIRSEPVFTDAQSVAQEMMQRAKHNLELLVERLTNLKYRFIAPDKVWTPPDEKRIDAINVLEQRHGSFPMVVRKWYEVVGEVNFMGAHPKLSHHRGLDWGGSEQLQCDLDPMLVSWPGHRDNELLSFYINLADDWDEMARIEEESPPPYGLAIGLSAIDKANQSGGGPIQMLIPCPGFDAPLIDRDDYWMGAFFVPYLRACFKWGGFPGLNRLEESERPKQELDILTDGLLAL
jgi:hypothetical protein